MPTTKAESKWFLASTTVRAILVALVPTLRTVLGLFSIELDNDVLMSLVDGVSIVCGVGAAVYLWIARNRNGKLTLMPSKKTV